VIEREFVARESPTMPRLGHGSHPCQGLYHRPADSWPTTAFIASHYNVDFAEHYLGPHLAELGVGFLGWNTRYRGAEAYFLLEHAVTDIGVGVHWLREHGVERVVLLGNSGGGSLMAAYQSTTTGADAYVSLNAHLGRPEVLTAWMDPSVVDEADPLSRDPSLDMFDPANGPPYAPEFVARYRAAQVARNERITAWARAEQVRLDEAGAVDRVFALHRVWADPRFLDLSLDPSERTTGCYAGDPRRANFGPLGIGRSNTLRTWLSMWSLEESQCRGAPHLARIDVPSLVVQSLGDKGVFPSDAQAIFDAIGTDEKTLQLVAGAHYFEEGEERRAEVARLLVDWLG
jgi:pimeloyl-ACP methyl ester carboxylesterase